MGKISLITAFFLLLVGAAASIPSPAKPQTLPSGVTRTVFFSLEPGEEIKRAESTIAVSALAEDVVLILAKSKSENGPFTVFRDGVKLPAPLDIVAFQDNGRTPA